MSGDGQPPSSQSVKGVRQGISICLDGFSPIPGRKTPHYLRGNPSFIVFVVLLAAACCVPAPEHQHSTVAGALARQTYTLNRQ